jgi:hypothetical protein
VARQTVVSDVVAATSSVSFWVPDYFCPSAWIEHAPFAFWLCEALRPRRFVELGTHYGYSYFAFCQASDRLGLGTAAYAVDTWKTDEYAGFYNGSVFQSVVTHNNDKYSAFSTLIRSTFEDALDYFADGSVDLLHIDGRHFYNDVKQDFARGRPKLTEDAVVLLHDTNVREREFGVWKFFEEVAARRPSFQFLHGHRLGVLVPGDRAPAPLAPLLEASRQIAHQIRAAYAALGGALGERHRQIEAQNTERAQSLGEIEFDIRRPGTERLAATIKRTPGDGIPGDVSRDEARVKNVAVASGLAAHLVPSHGQHFDIGLLSGSKIDGCELIDVAVDIAVDRDDIVSGCDIAVEGSVRFRDPGHTAVEPEIRGSLHFIRSVIPIDPDPCGAGRYRRDDYRTRRRQLRAIRRDQQGGDCGATQPVGNGSTALWHSWPRPND